MLRTIKNEVFTENSLLDESDRIVHFIEHAENLAASDKLDEAAHAYRLALAEKPNDPECLLRLSHVLMRMKCYSECFHHARHFLRLVDDISFGFYLAGHAARELGRWQEARTYLLRAVELDPSHLFARVLCCMSVFTVCMNEAEAQSMMQTYATELDQLIHDTVFETAGQRDSAVDGIGALAPFFLPYLGYNVTALQEKYGNLVCSVMAARYPHYAQPLPPRSPDKNDKLKIGIVSHYFHNHSHWKIVIKGWMEQLDRNLFSIHCFYTGALCDDVTTYARSIADSFVQCDDCEQIMGAIVGQKLDVVLHSGIGMDTITLKLAGLRLAPVQCTTIGHPLTTGMPTMDYFISGELVEPADGDRHYTEKLIRLPNLSIYCEQHETSGGSCADFSVPDVQADTVIFLCCQNLMKYLPGYDHVFPDIARKTKNARFVFIECPVAEFTERFSRRLEQAFKYQGLNSTDHVTFVPFLNQREYAALNTKADIFLDSIGWAGGNTTLESLPFNKPIVTLPGSYMRGRVTYGMLKMMGMEDLIAADVDEYIAISVRLADDPAWRSDISERISRNKHKIYRDRTCIAGLETFLMTVSGRCAVEL